VFVPIADPSHPSSAGQLQRLAPPADSHLDRAQELLGDFARFWHAEPDPAERRKLLASLFDHIWQDAGRIVAVKPRSAFAAYFKAIDQARPTPPKGKPKGGVTKAGATGLEPATSGVTGRRSNQLSYAPALRGSVRFLRACAPPQYANQPPRSPSSSIARRRRPSIAARVHASTALPRPVCQGRSPAYVVSSLWQTG
jgi:hypothetical protein